MDGSWIKVMTKDYETLQLKNAIDISSKNLYFFLNFSDFLLKFLQRLIGSSLIFAIRIVLLLYLHALHSQQMSI